MPFKVNSTVLVNSSSAITSTPTIALDYERYTLSQGVIHVIHIPHQSQFVIAPAIAPGLAPLDQLAQEYGAIAAVNGGFFDPTNGKTTSYVVLQGEVVADPTENERLVTNPDLLPYLEQIFDRTEFRQYQCGDEIRYDITAHRNSPPAGCQLQSSLGAGPRLLPELTLEEEGFTTIINGETVRDALGSTQPNARTAIGINLAGDVVLVMAAQLPNPGAEAGISLQALAEFMKTLGIEKAMNLDGGSSSSLYFQGETHYGKVNAEGNWVERPIKSALLVLQET
ncbi:MAG: hypothetical protein Kow00121_32310 [Elainellaceae cyanobacterium]